MSTRTTPSNTALAFDIFSLVSCKREKKNLTCLLKSPKTQCYCCWKNKHACLTKRGHTDQDNTCRTYLKSLSELFHLVYLERSQRKRLYRFHNIESKWLLFEKNTQL